MKYVCIDIGNVLCKVDLSQFIALLSKIKNISKSDALNSFNEIQKLHDLGFTNLSNELSSRFKIYSELLIDELIHEWSNIITPDKDVLDKLNFMIDTKDLKVALLSNIGVEHAKQMSNILGYNNFIDKSIRYFSCEVGARKPSTIYYQSFLQLHPEFVGAAYIDDLQENLDASKKFGFRTFRFALSEIKHSERYSKIKELEKFILEK